MTEVIRTLTYEEIDDSLSLSSFAFQYELTNEERARRRSLLNLSRSWGAFIDGELAAKMVHLHLEVQMNGIVLPMGGIASVATWPEYRRRGLVAKLLKHALQELRGQGFGLSYLAPFSFEFYRKFGWEACFDYKSYEIEMSQLAYLRKLEHHGKMRNVASAEAKWHLFRDIYDQYSKQYNGGLVRSESWWQDLLRKPGRYSIYYDHASQPAGYICYEVKEQIITVREWAFLHEEARYGLLQFIANHDSMANLVKMVVPIDDELPFLLANPKFKQEWIPYFMARIVDFVQFAAQYPFQGDGQPHQLLVELRDEHAAWNHGSFVLRIDEAGKAIASLLPAEGHGANAEMPRLQLDVQMLTVLMLGYRRPLRLYQLGKIHGDQQAIQLLERLIPVQTTYIADFF